MPDQPNFERSVVLPLAGSVAAAVVVVVKTFVGSAVPSVRQHLPSWETRSVPIWLYLNKFYRGAAAAVHSTLRWDQKLLASKSHLN